MPETKKDIKLSIIIPSYNYGKYINECLDSIFEQPILRPSDLTIEVIIIDDCSTDNSIEILNKYKASHNISNLFIYQKHFK